MHELPVTQNILEIGIKHAERAEAQRIVKIHLTIGQFASVIDDSIEFYWNLISKDTIAEGSTLTFKRIPAEFECLECRKAFIWDDIEGNCPSCGGLKVKLITGNEFYIDSIEVE